MNAEIVTGLHPVGRTAAGLTLTTIGTLGTWASGVKTEPEPVLFETPWHGPRVGDRFVGRTRGGQAIFSL